MINSHHNLLFKAIVLALCVIYSVHLFVFPLYGVESGNIPVKTYKNFEQTLCANNFYKTTPMKLKKRCPNDDDGIVTVIQGGRIGNQLWEYATVWAIARRTGLTPFIPRCIKTKLEQIFQHLTIPTFQEIQHCPLFQKKFVKSFDEWNFTNQSIILPKYSLQPNLVLPWIQKLRLEFKFRKSLLRKAETILKSAAKTVASPAVFVSLHIRRTDYLNRVKLKYSTEPAGLKFYKNSMDFFARKYKNVVFIAVSDDPKWCVRNLPKNVYVTGKLKANTPALDLTILSLCNHSIFDYGTFGQWGALLAGGETIFYGIKQHSSYRIGQLLPNWYALTPPLN